MNKVFIGVGHGGTDSGSSANGFKEKDLNLPIALACTSVLTRHGVNVLMSRTTDAKDPLIDEINECNKFSPVIAVDIHCNAGGGDGVEAYYHYKGGLSLTLATNVVNEIAKTGQNLRTGTSGKKDGLKYRKNAQGKDYYGFIRQTKAPAVIVECAFIDNKTDIAIIDTAAEQKAMGEAIAKGILKTLGLKYVEEKKPETSGKWYKVQVGAFQEPENAENLKAELVKKGYSAIVVEG